MRNTLVALIVTVITVCRFVFPTDGLCFPMMLEGEVAPRVCLSNDQAGHPSEWPAPERGVVALDQAMRDIRSPFVVACVAARPGDEDSAALVYCRKKLGAQTVAVFATHGEQGENEAQSTAQEPAGVIRTCQALEVAGAEGADAYFLNLPDQPAEQPADDTYGAWEKKDGLLSVVRFIRTVHPDVIMSGGELSSADKAELAVQRLAMRGIDSAADPGQFPEAGSPWSVKRLYIKGTQSDQDATVHAGEFDMVRGRTYAGIAELARRAYVPEPGHERADTIYYKVARPAESASGSAGGSVVSGLTVTRTVEEVISAPDLGSTDGIPAADRRRIAQVLSGRLYVLRSTGSDEDLRERFGADFFRVARFMRCLERAIGLALGLDFEMRSNDEAVVPGQRFGVKLTFTNGTGQELAVEFQAPAAFPAPGAASTLKTDLTKAEAGRSLTKDYEYQAPDRAVLTVPHGLHLYDSNFFPVGDGRWPRGRPFGLPFAASARVNVGPVSISLQAITMIDVIPSFELSAKPPAALLRDFETARTIDFTARVVNHTPGPFVGELWVVPLAVAKDDYEPVQVRFLREDEEVEVPLKLQAPILKPPLATSILLEFRRPRPAAPEALASVKIDVRAAGLVVAEGLQVGYISTVGSRLAEALGQLGCRHELLTMQNLRFADGGTDLKRFDSIIVDRDAYRDLPELVALNSKLLDYARAGGNLIVMSQPAADWNSVPGLAPFPITLSKLPMKLQMSAARLANDPPAVLTQPNRIEAGDLASWPVSRKTHVPEAWDSQYQSLIAYGPADRAAGQSLLLFARAGEGTYSYVAVDADEAIAGVNPGAYRLISNLLGLPKSKGSSSSTGSVK